MSGADGLIAVTGATGAVGGRVARLLAEHEVAQRLVVRDPSRAPQLPGAEVRGATGYGYGAVARRRGRRDRGAADGRRPRRRHLRVTRLAGHAPRTLEDHLRAHPRCLDHVKTSDIRRAAD